MQTKEILTPALLLDLDAFETNLKRMVEHVHRAGKALRPHAKAHKCVEIAKRQLAAGACGVCVATLSEAELMSRGGITGLLLTSPVADPAKIARIAATGAMVVVDHVKQVEWYQNAGRKIDVLVDLDVGDHRTGARTPAQAVEVAEAVDRASNLNLRGLQAYSVVGSHAAPDQERARVSKEVFGLAAETRDAMARKGLSTEILSGGSTGTWQIDTALPELTEMQAGSFVLMDMAYRRAGVDFRQGITVLATVVSANHENFVSVDAGTKSFSTDRGYGPEAVNLPGSGYRWGGDEFGYVDVDDPATRPCLGDKLEFIPPHCDPTVNLYTSIYACRGNQVEAVWPLKSLG
ncbi:MAG: DSD1 family PLP-dependent enzyme [Acidobacteriota bacterium]|nr:DSD1 family PLP-dependent enzyme [Acidobacteriota bacterium]